MITRTDLSSLDWTLSGWTPHLWRLMQTIELGETPTAEIQGFAAKVPGSVQSALLQAGLIPDWNVGTNWLQCEWVENRHWIYETVIPAAMLREGKVARLVCEGLDYRGEIQANCATIGTFVGTHVPHTFDLSPYIGQGDLKLRIIFDLPPRWLGQFGYTSRVKEWKVRFNYTWDWQPRLVQTGIWAPIRLEVGDGCEIGALKVVADADVADGAGSLRVGGRVDAAEGCEVAVRLAQGDTVVREERLPAPLFNAGGVAWRGLDVDLWWPNLEGAQPLYRVDVTVHRDGCEVDSRSRTVGFRHIAWEPCEGAPKGADPWLCVVNGRRVFLQGVNFPPVLPNFADATYERYHKLLALYRDLGANIFRVNGVGYLETETFYDLCDEMGVLVWQDMPLSSSGTDSDAPTDDRSIDEMGAILRSFIERRQHHASLLLWCGGNELQKPNADGLSVPLGLDHPMLARFRDIVQEFDPTRRFLATTSTGPRFYAQPEDFGKGLHWDVHGPWKAAGGLDEWDEYWAGDDALFRSETGAPGACSADVIRQYAGGLDPMPVTPGSLLWRRPLTWWIEEGQFAVEHGRAPETLEEYVDWSQDRQARALSTAVGTCKARFPRCGGIMLWCGHDCFPCPANTSIIDVHGDPKPAALALREIWRKRPG